MLPANVVAARWEYRRRAVELEELYTPSFSLGSERSEESDKGYSRSAFPAIADRDLPIDCRPFGWRLRPWRASAGPGDIGEVIRSQPRLVRRRAILAQGRQLCFAISH